MHPLYSISFILIEALDHFFVFCCMFQHLDVYTKFILFHRKQICPSCHPGGPGAWHYGLGPLWPIWTDLQAR